MKKRVRDLLHFFQYITIMSLTFFLSFIPDRLIKQAGKILGFLIFIIWRKRRMIARESIKIAVEMKEINLRDDVDTTVRKVFYNLGRYILELIKIYHKRGEKILNNVRIKGIENFNEAKRRGRGIIFITCHGGNWELMAIAFSRLVEPFCVVARPLNNPYLNRLIERVRSNFGNRVIYKKGALREIVRTLNKNMPVGVLMDQSVLRDEGVFINFLGRPAWTTKMPALIGKRTGAVILPAFIKSDNDHHIIEIQKKIDLSGDELKDTRALTSVIEDYIKRYPHEWLWIHRRWKKR